MSGRVRRWVGGALAGTLGLALLCAAGSVWLWTHQGLTEGELNALLAEDGASVEFDAHGIPTVRGPDWRTVLRAQGTVVAAQRLWQMDLARRFASGRRAEWFGAAAVEHDRSRRLQDWPRTAVRLADRLPRDQRADCDAFAAGVNRAIGASRWRWGIEYVLLRQSPELWSCSDTLLIYLDLTDKLDGFSDREAAQGPWRDALSPAWESLLFPQDHPWNTPLFGGEPLPELPPREQWLPPTSVADLVGEAPSAEAALPGSNSWVWSGPTGTFVANDPHLGATVPQIFFLNRLIVAEDDWVVGASVPGIHGVLLGMNPHLAWGFTNTLEDVDDFVAETLHPDGRQVLAPDPRVRLRPAEDLWPSEESSGEVDDVPSDESSGGVDDAPSEESSGEVDDVPSDESSGGVGDAPSGTPAPVAPLLSDEEPQWWEPIDVHRERIEVDGAAPVVVQVRVTPRGPLIPHPYEPNRWVSRQWIPARAEVGTLPVLALNRAVDWASFNRAIDAFTFPTLSIVMAESGGAIGYRASGSGVVRGASGKAILSPAEGMWQGLEPPSTRPRVRLEPEPGAAVSLQSANALQWPDPYPNEHGPALRTARIREVLAGKSSWTQAEMERLQLDTTSRYYDHLLDWVLSQGPQGVHPDRLASWRAWDGDALSDPRTFTEAHRVDGRLRWLLLRAVRRHLVSEEAAPRPYTWLNANAWVLVVLEEPEGLAAFGLDAREVATHLVGWSAQSELLYSEENRWRAQHPFVGRIPVLGEQFRIAEPTQVGFSELLRFERPTYGPAVRLVWNLREPRASTWIAPVGQSGHRHSTHYDDLQSLWHQGERLPVWPDGLEP